MLTTLSKIINTDDLDEIFAILQEDCGVQAASIYETNGEKIKLRKFFKEKLPQTAKPQFDLKIQGVKFGIIVFAGNTETKLLQIISEIISDKIKNYEFKQIMSQQISALQEGILTQASESRAKSNFFASVTHELRTPLNSIIGYSELLLQGLGEEKKKEFLLDIQTSGLNLLNMINDILDYSKINAGTNILNISEFDIERLFFEVSNTITPLLKKKQLTLDTNIQNFSIKADYRKTTQILINLLSNAIKFSLIGDKIELISRISDKNKIIEVRDFGIGIPKRSQKKVFKEFTQAPNNTSKENSTGLGLAIVKKFCDLQGWKIELESEENKGALFRIIIS